MQMKRASTGKLYHPSSLVSQREAAAPAYKLSKDHRVTVMVCANATAGTHKMPLLLIGESKNLCCFKNVKIP